MDDLSEMYLRFTFDLVAREAFDHLHWGLFRDVPEEPERLAEAQDRYADALLAMIPDGVDRVLDVGCGLGGIARMLAAKGHEVVASSPRQDHCELVASVPVEGLTVRCERFEDLPAGRDFDLLLFAESFNFFVDQNPENAEDSVASFTSLAADHVQPKGYVLLADIITPEIHAAISKSSRFAVISDHDVHDEARYTSVVLQRLFDRHVVPYQHLLDEVLGHEDPHLARQLRQTLDRVPNQSLQQIFAGRMVEPELAERNRYRMLLLQHRD